MERVTGIGGLFFRAQDPERLSAWYADHLGVNRVPESYETAPWWQQAGPTVFAAMPSDSDGFGGADRQWSVNFRVADLDAMVRQLRGAGIRRRRPRGVSQRQVRHARGSRRQRRPALATRSSCSPRADLTIGAVSA